MSSGFRASEAVTNQEQSPIVASAEDVENGNEDRDINLNHDVMMVEVCVRAGFGLI